jgi:hypothetical protein
MSANENFVARAEYGACGDCGTILGDIVAQEGGEEKVVQAKACCSPICTGKNELIDGLDPSLLYRVRALVFVPEEKLEGGTEKGHVVAVLPEDVHDEILRHDSPVILTDVRWPADRKHFISMLNHHIHHEAAPNITQLNDGWDSSRKVPVL